MPRTSSAKSLATPSAASQTRAPVPSNWPELSDEALLDLRLCDLPITIQGSKLEARIQQLYDELAARQILFRPHFWLSDEWFTPDGVGGIALPFYLAHPRLEKLEEAMMLEVEGGTDDWCMKIMRHEAGHAIDHAFELQRRRKRQKLFGSSAQEYPQFYTPKPYSKSFVLHLDMWYAQSHPDEDFAETFAVWLTPDAHWHTRYAGWPAFRKLEYMDELMTQLAGAKPTKPSRRRVYPLARIKRTLGQHYERKSAHYGLEYPDFYDRDLRRLFSENSGTMSAARFLSRIRKDVLRRVARWTGEYQYTINQVIVDMIVRCRELKLRLDRPEDQVKLEFTVLLTVQTMNYLHSGRHRVAL
ncbi:MAG: hypothetical protein GEU99_03980 [Luteitalea sp.]|nr:hypothetical protein [Luteitalea sp.]